MKTFLAQGMANTPVIGVPAGTLAIYDSGPSGTDHSPAVYPHLYASKVHFHSAFDYLGATDERTVSVTLPAVNSSTVNTGEIALFSHGRGAVPMVMAQVSSDGSNWLTLNGTAYANLSLSGFSRSINVVADSVHVSVFWAAAGNYSATTLHFRVQVLDRNFGSSKPLTNEAFYASQSRVAAARGVFDTNKRYLQAPSAGQAAQIRHYAGQTLNVQDSSIQSVLENVYWNEVNQGVVRNVPITGNSGLNVAVPSPVSLVYDAPTPTGSRSLDISPGGIVIRTPSGYPIIDTSKSILAITDEYQATVTLPSQGAVAAANEVPHHTVLAQKSLPAGSNIILGWLQVLSSSGAQINTYRSIDFSGSIQLWRKIQNVSGNGWTNTQNLIISPKLVGNTLQVVMTWFNQSWAGVPATNTPSVTVKFHLFAARFTGGG